MKFLILATAAVASIFSFTSARRSAAAEGPQTDSMTIVSSGQQKAGTAIRLAMGPTSAARLPGGTGDGRKETPSIHKKAKHRHKNFAPN